MRYVIAFVLTLLMASPVLANQCPTLVRQIDDQLASRSLDPAAEKQIRTLRDQGEALHKQGKHEESVKVLDEALEKLKAAS